MEQKRPLTQIDRILKELGIQRIPAYSPQAKGRIEHSLQTLKKARQFPDGHLFVGRKGYIYLLEPF